jgi:hypothetical protein
MASLQSSIRNDAYFWVIQVMQVYSDLTHFEFADGLRVGRSYRLKVSVAKGCVKM